MAKNRGYRFPIQDPSDESSDAPGQPGGSTSGSDWWNDVTVDPPLEGEYALPPPHPTRRAWPRILLFGGIALAVVLALAAVGIWVVRPYILERRAEGTPTAPAATAQPSEVVEQPTAPIITTQAPPVSPGTAEPGGEPEPAQDAGPLAVASYDAKGNLESVLGPSGEPVTDTAAFPPSLETSQEYVPLSSAAQALSQLTTLEGAAYDGASGELVLIGRSVPGDSLLNADDLLVAFLSLASGEYPGVSIDPGPSRQEMNVRYLGPTEKTHFGEVMFEADRLLKTLSFGTDNITGEAVSSTVPDFQTELDLAAAFNPFGSETEPVWHRFWYVVNRMRLGMSQDGHSISFLQSDLKVNTEYLGTDFQPVPNHAPDPEAQAFADHFTEHYAGFAAEFPVVGELVELAKMVSLAQWIADQEIPLDPTWLTMQSPAFVDTPETTPAITVTRELSRTTPTGTGSLTELWILTLYGGVDLTLQNEYEVASPSLGAEALSGRPAAVPSTWSFASADGLERRAVAVPLQPVEKLTAGMFRPVDDLGLAALGDVGLPFSRQYRAADSEPGELGYGWRIPLSRLEFPLEARQYTLEGGTSAAYTLYPEVILFEGLRRQRRRYLLAAVRSDGAIIYQADSGEELILLSDGSYMVSNGAAELSFDASGLLIRAEDGSGNRAQYQYTGSRLTRIETSGGLQIDLSYDSGRVSQVTLNGGKTLRYTYDGRGDLVEVVDDQGQAVWRYAYDSSHHLLREEKLLQGTERRLVYDDAGRVVAYGDSTGDYEVEYAPLGKILISRFARQIDEPIQASATVRPDLLVGAGVQAFRQAVGSKFDSDLTLFQEIRRDSSFVSGVTLVYAARPGARQVALLVGDQYVSLPIKEASDPAILRRKLAESGALPATGRIVVVGPAQGTVDLQGALLGQVVLNAQGLDAATISGNYSRLSAEPVPTRQSVAFVNAVPRSREELERIGMDPDSVGHPTLGGDRRRMGPSRRGYGGGQRRRGHGRGRSGCPGEIPQHGDHRCPQRWSLYPHAGWHDPGAE